MAAAAPYILMAAGTAANVAGQRNAASKRRSILNEALQRTDKTQEKSNQALVEEGSNYGAKRNEAVQQQEQSALAQALKDIGARDQTGAGAQLIDTAGDAGAVSGDFLKAKADRAVSEGTRLTNIARELAKVRAPGRQLNDEALRRSSLLEQVGSDYASNNAYSRAAGLDAQNVEEPGWGKLGALAASIGSAWGGSGGGAPQMDAGQIAQNSGAYPNNWGYQQATTQPRLRF